MLHAALVLPLLQHFVQASGSKNIGEFLFHKHGDDEGKRLQFAKVPYFKLSLKLKCVN